MFAMDDEELSEKTIKLLDEATALYEKLIPQIIELKKPNLAESRLKRLKTSVRQIKKELSEKFDLVLGDPEASPTERRVAERWLGLVAANRAPSK